MKRRTNWKLLVIALSVVWVLPAPAQERPDRRPAAVISPELLEDGKIAFRILAPKAKSVQLVSPDLGGLNESGALSKNIEGIWEVVLWPVDPPRVIRYQFDVDGMRVPDPANRETSEANATVFSSVLVPGSKWMEVQDVPHGAVSEVVYQSDSLGRFRRMHIYTPPGYESGKETYPVFYLLHGATDSDDSWTTAGRANVILDNLIAEGKAVPMVVVMPDGHVSRFGRGRRGFDMDEFVKEFREDIVPHVHKTYRVHTDRSHTAIAGLSMGGAQTLNIIGQDLEKYGFVGVYSSGIFGINRDQGDAPNWEEKHLDVLTNPDSKVGLEHLWFATGHDDFLVDVSRQTVALFEKYGFDVTYKETAGGHTWINWREYLHEFAPMLFKVNDAKPAEVQAAANSAATPENSGAERKATDRGHNIKNDIFWNTAAGEPIFSQGGGIFRFKDPETNTEKFYWYGVEYDQAVRYREDPSVTFTRGNHFNAVTCYSSTDLVNWESEGEVLTREEAYKNGGPRGWPWIARLGVVYFDDSKKYVMVSQYGAGILFSVADTPKGPFKWHRRKDMTETIGTPNTGDQTVFTDEDTGKSYLVYSYGRGRNKIYISEIGLKGDEYDLLDCTQVYRGSGREGNCMFKYKGKYYLAASNLYGWDSSYAYYLVADDIRGPYRPENNMKIMEGTEDDYAHITQTGFFVTIKGTEQETVIYCGDRWAAFAGNGLGYNQWCPLSFGGDEPYFNSLNSWDLDVVTGRWEVATDNNWVKNPSFEADRKDMPSADKPKQERLLGWTTKVVRGTEISLDRGSPKLNHANSTDDRKQVIGERCLNMSDRTDFTRQVSQVITSSAYVEFEDGEYVMTAKVKHSDGFERLRMFADSGSERFSVSINGENSVWKTIKLEGIHVSDNKVEIGFLADGRADAFCWVDDVSFVKANARSSAPDTGASLIEEEGKSGIRVIRDIAYREGDSEAWRLDLAMPTARSEELRPALVIVHGGGWRGGSKTVDVFQKMMTDYAEKGYVTINVDYRLLGEAPFPACIEDVKCAVRWLRANAEKYHIDPDRIGAYGHSAGAHLAMMLAMTPKSAGLEGDGGWEQFSSQVNAVAAGSPPTELGRDAPMARKEWWPIGYISADHPPMLLIQGSADRIVRAELTDDFVEKMKVKGAKVEYLRIDGGRHGVAYAEHLDVTAPAIEKFLAKHLKPKPAQARARASAGATPIVVIEDGGTGPYPAVATEDPHLPGMTIYRPRDLTPFGDKEKLPLLLWGNGACANTTQEHRNFLSEIASHGYLILAIGLLDQIETRDESSRQLTKSSQLLVALDWATAENESGQGAYAGKLDSESVAAMGMSCGGLQAIEISGDPRISTSVICNSGVLPTPSPLRGMPPLSKEVLKKIHAPVLYIMGGPKDIAYKNAMDDFARVDHVPIVMTNLDVGHAGTYARPRGGEYTPVALAWLDWQLKGNRERSKMFLGEDSTLGRDPKWDVESKNFD